MTTAIDTPRLREIRTALAIDTTGMGSLELADVWKLVDELKMRVTCEEWAASLGWDIPPYATSDWITMQNAWLESEDEA